MAIAMRDDPEAGLTLVDAALEPGELANFCLAHSARADRYRRLGSTADALASYEKAPALIHSQIAAFNPRMSGTSAGAD